MHILDIPRIIDLHLEKYCAVCSDIGFCNQMFKPGDRFSTGDSLLLYVVSLQGLIDNLLELKFHIDERSDRSIELCQKIDPSKSKNEILKDLAFDTQRVKAHLSEVWLSTSLILNEGMDAIGYDDIYDSDLQKAVQEHTQTAATVEQSSSSKANPESKEHA